MLLRTVLTRGGVHGHFRSDKKGDIKVSTHWVDPGRCFGSFEGQLGYPSVRQSRDNRARARAPAANQNRSKSTYGTNSCPLTCFLFPVSRFPFPCPLSCPSLAFIITPYYTCAFEVGSSNLSLSFLYLPFCSSLAIQMSLLAISMAIL